MSLRVKAHDAATYYGISISNLRKWAREGAIPTERTKKGRFIYIIPNGEQPQRDIHPDDWNEEIIYARVSSKKQAGDLQRQIQTLKIAYPHFTLVKDIGSGLNYERPGFRSLLERLFQGKVKRVVVAYQDRFSRFGFDFFQWLFTRFGAVLESMEEPRPKTGDDMVADIMEVFKVFTTRYYESKKPHPSPETPGISIPSPKATVS